VVSADALGGGTGSIDNPYTLAEMFALINGAAAGVFGGTMFMLRDGVYTWSTDGELHNGGTKYADLIIAAEHPRQAILRAAAGPATTRKQCFKPTLGTPANYITWDGLWIDGNFSGGGIGNLGIQTVASCNLHHFTVQNCRFSGLQGNGAEFASCDYVTWRRNIVYQVGLRQPGSDVPNSGSSALTLNAKTAPFAFDSYPGFHNFVYDNLHAAVYGKTTDGNGIILDNGGGSTGGNDGKGSQTLQNTLIGRNIVYGCGGRGIYNKRCDAPVGGGHWWVNNLCFKNNLDKTLTFTTNGFGSEFGVQLGNNTNLANNVAVPWTGTGNYGSTAYRDDDGALTSVYHLFSNSEVSGGRNSSHLTGGAGQIDIISDPGFTAALGYNPDTIGDAFLVPDPATIGNAFIPTALSVLKDTGIDPRALGTMTPEMISDINSILALDLRGWVAPQ
jgi:hypothetical protein